jgi:hypothetical protein
MNERIEKLIEQCTVQEFSDCTGGFDTFDKVKFAELIVRECEKVAKDGPWYYDTPSLRSGWQNPINHVCNVMKEHFGVKE